jgi:hypothetical protein
MVDRRSKARKVLDYYLVFVVHDFIRHDAFVAYPWRPERFGHSA